MASVNQQPFRFMDLPKEVRLMVYERLPRQVRHFKVDVHDELYTPLILVVRTCSTAILRVSKVVHSEAGAIVSKIVRAWILDHPCRALAGYHILYMFRGIHDLIALCADDLWPGVDEGGRTDWRGLLKTRSKRHCGEKCSNPRADYGNECEECCMTTYEVDAVHRALSIFDTPGHPEHRMQFFQYIYQAARIKSSRNSSRYLELVISRATPNHPSFLARPFPERRHILPYEMDIYIGGDVSHREFKIAAIRRSPVPSVLGEDTHKLLEPGIDDLDKSAQPADATEVMSKDEWYNGWVERCE